MIKAENRADAASPSADDRGTSPIESLDPELFSMIVKHVDRVCYPALAFVCRRFAQMMRHRQTLRDQQRRTTGETVHQVATWETDPFDPTERLRCCARCDRRRGWQVCWSDYVETLICTMPCALVRWALDEGLFVYECAQDIAARAGRLDTLIFLAERMGMRFPADVAVSAAKAGHVRIVEWLYTRYGAKVELGQVCRCASEWGHPHMLEWLRAQGCDTSHSTICILLLIRRGHLNVLQWLHDTRQLHLSPNMPTCALVAARMDIAHWLFRLGCPIEREPYYPTSIVVTDLTKQLVAQYGYVHDDGWDTWIAPRTR